MAMAFAPLCLKIGKVFIENPACVQKSFPNYWQVLQELGFVIRQI
jgi:3-phosphoshikimate 1-carboxyvinyltransferase